jgi:hypothetical protein
MKHVTGPTKKLAPTIGPDTSCPHSYSDDEGVQLEIECSECAGAHDLENNKCLTGILNVMIAGAEPDAIILKRFIHKRYRGEVVRRTAFAASELAALNRTLVAVEPSSDKRCRTCTASTERIVLAMKQRLLENPFEYAASRTAIVKDIELGAFAHACENARTCVDKGLRMTMFGRG